MSVPVPVLQEGVMGRVRVGARGLVLPMRERVCHVAAPLPLI